MQPPVALKELKSPLKILRPIGLETATDDSVFVGEACLTQVDKALGLPEEGRHLRGLDRPQGQTKGRKFMGWDHANRIRPKKKKVATESRYLLSSPLYG